MLTFRNSTKSFKLDGDLLETITNNDFNVDHSSLQGQKLINEFGKEMKIITREKGRKSNRDKSMIRLLNSPANRASGISTIVLSPDPQRLCDRLKLLI